MAAPNLSRRLTSARIAWFVTALLLLACVWLFMRPPRSRTVEMPPGPIVEQRPVATSQPSPAAPGLARIPLAPGLTIVSVAADRQLGDQHTITEVTSVTDDGVELKVSMDTAHNGRFDGTLLLSRSEMARSLHNNKLIYSNSPNTRTRSGSFLGPSSRVMTDLKTRGNATFFDWREPRTQVRRYQTGGGPEMAVVRVKTVENASRSFPVMVNGTLTQVPAIHVAGTLEWDVNGPLTNVEFDFLDDAENPLTLHRRETELVGDVTEIWLPGARSDTHVERQLVDSGKADAYGIFFDSGTATIRPGFEQVVQTIANALTRHPAWGLEIRGHTDSIGGEQANRVLSARRATAVKSALVERYKIDAARLKAVGFGASQPKDVNETLIGRARNRRVELVRLGQ
jgi:outer membrane protein OmpA-like peptidoglycan-associated protein